MMERSKGLKGVEEIERNRRIYRVEEQLSFRQEEVQESADIWIEKECGSTARKERKKRGIAL